MPFWKALMISLAINLILISLYIKFVTPFINEAANSLTSMMLGR
jgi:hypothetical protein